MTAVTGTKPHPIFLAGRWVESPDPLVVANPADDSTPAGSTFNATPEQYEEAVEQPVDHRLAALPVEAMGVAGVDLREVDPLAGRDP